MDRDKLINMLNKDLADEHAAILRYLIHSYLEGEDSPLGAGLLSRAREEMWHMHWLGMIIGRLGGEPNMKPAPYPYDPTNRKTIFKSYVVYEEKLIPHYLKEADAVDDPHIKRVLQREAWESEIHARKFQRTHDKLKPGEAEGLPGEDNQLSERFVEEVQQIVAAKYAQVLQSIRNAWVFQKNGVRAWEMMDFSMTRMKQLAHVSEQVAENGITPRLTGSVVPVSTLGDALSSALENLKSSRQAHLQLKADKEAQKHAGLLINLDLSIKQEAYEAEEINDWLK